MNKIGIICAALVLLTGGAQAVLVGFGEDFTDGTVSSVDFGTNWQVTGSTSDGVGNAPVAALVTSVTDTDNDITLTLTLTSANNPGSATVSSRDTLEDIAIGSGFAAGTGKAPNTEFELSGGEGLHYSLAISGTGAAKISTLALNFIDVRRWGNTETAIFYDGTAGTGNSVSLTGNVTGDDVSYDGSIGQALSGLTALTAANANTWVLEQWGNASESTGLGSIGFEYTVIPEPATLGLFVFVGGGMLWIRRKFTI
jgi:hypothetical protein